MQSHGASARAAVDEPSPPSIHRAERPSRRSRLRWRKLLRDIHRDAGFACIGLTLIYAVSGVAVNHRRDWNYNVSTTVEQRSLGSPARLLGGSPATPAGELARERQAELVERVRRALGRSDHPRKAFWRGADRLSIFMSGSDTDVIDYHPSTGIAEHRVKRDRLLLRVFNRLHLNDPGGAWTWVADLFAGALFFLAISGMLIVKGRRGLRGRGGVLMALGVLLPIIAILMLR